MTTTYGGFEHYTVKTQKLLALNHDDMCPHVLSVHAAIHAPCAIYSTEIHKQVNNCLQAQASALSAPDCVASCVFVRICFECVCVCMAERGGDFLVQSSVMESTAAFH